MPLPLVEKAVRLAYTFAVRHRGDCVGESPDQGLLQEIESSLRHHHRWRRIMSVAYFLTAAAVIVFSGAATIVAGIGQSMYAAILAGGATVLVGLEKGMLFREKWSHRLTISAQLEVLKNDYRFRDVSREAAAERLNGLLGEHAVRLPIATRRDGREE